MTALDELLTDEEGLKPCPFCGSNGIVNMRDGGCSVQCEKCYAEGEFFKERHCNYHGESKFLAIEAWNTRPREEKLASVCKVLVEALGFYADKENHLPDQNFKSPISGEYRSPIYNDKGRKAKTALSKAEKIAGVE